MVLTSFPLFAPRYLQVLTRAEHPELVAFALNPEQLALDAVKQQLRDEGKAVRVLILKPRRIGYSAYEQGDSFWRCATRRNIRALTLADTNDNAQTVYEIARRFEEGVRDKAARWLAGSSSDPPAISTSPAGRGGFHFLDTGSQFTIATAGSHRVGQGGEIHKLHASEAAHWIDPESVWPALMGALAPGAEVVLETTAGGHDPLFWTLWQGSEQGRNDYVRHFVAWHDVASNRIGDPGPWQEVKGLDRTETRLCESYALDAAQIRWWRAKRRELELDSEGRSIDAEFPSDSVTCFVTRLAGRIFAPDEVRDFSADAEEPKRRETIPGGEILTWEEPVQGVEYVIGADTSEGLPTSNPSPAYCVTRREGRIVAAIHGRIPPRAYAGHLADLGLRYGSAMIAVEAQKDGGTVLDHLVETIGYGNIFRHELAEPGKHAAEKRWKLGWQTNGQTRPTMMSDMYRAVKDGREAGLWVRDQGLANELSTLIQTPQGRVQAAPGFHDDRVMAAAIAWQVRSRTIYLDPVLFARPLAGGTVDPMWTPGWRPM